MPVGIDHASSERVVLAVQEFVSPVAVEHGSSMLATNVKDILVGICSVGRMAVDAMILRQGVLQYSTLIEI